MGPPARFESMQRPACETRYSTTDPAAGECGQILETLKGQPPSNCKLQILSLEIDLRRNGGIDGLKRLMALSSDQIIEVAVDLDYALEKKSEFVLPLGSPCKFEEPGSVAIADEIVVLDADRPGLFALEMTKRHARGRNLELLHSHIQRLTRKLACRRIGLPSPHHIVDRDSRHLLQFPPLTEAGGVVLQRLAFETGAARFCAASPAQIRAFAEDIVKDMRALWKKRCHVGARVQAIRGAIDRDLAAHSPTVSVRSIDIDMQDQRDDDEFSLYVEYHAIDEAMRPGLVLDFVPPDAGVNGRTVRLPFGVWGRSEERDELKDKGADGTIHDLALGLLAVAPEGPAAILAELATSYEANIAVTTSGAPLTATLYWQNGKIVAELSIAGRLDWVADKVHIKNVTLPEVILNSVVGRPVSSLIELPFEPGCEISGIRTYESGALMLELTAGEHFIDLSTGRTWK